VSARGFAPLLHFHEVLPLIGDEVSHLYDIPKCFQYFKELLVEKVAPPKAGATLLLKAIQTEK